jgi:DNA-directed RNA polymerase subunit beta'
MGHISLSAPVTNIALYKVLATNLSKLLGIPSKKLEDIIYLRAYVVIDNGLTNLLTKGEVLEKRIDRSLISDILQEIIQNKELSKSVIEEAKELNEKITKKIDKSNEEITDVVFLDDYLDFLEKHCRVKIWTGTEAFRELLVGIDIAAELAKVKQAVKENPQKVSNEKLRFLQGLQRSGLKLE